MIIKNNTMIFIVLIFTLFLLVNCTKPVEVDNQLPVVAILQPENGETITEPVLIQVNATDNEGIEKVEFYIDSLLIKTDDEPEYEAYLNPFFYSDGNTHTILVIATDINENKSIPVEILITIPAGLENSPELIQPENNDFILSGNAINFVWRTYLEATNYDLTIARDIEFTEIIHETNIIDTIYSTTLEETSQLFWKIRAFDQFGNPSNWSIIRNLYHDNRICFKKEYESIEGSRIIKTIQLENGSYISLGSVGNSSLDSKTILLKTDKFGNQQWIELYDDKQWHVSSDIVRLDDGSLVAVGYTQGDQYSMALVKFSNSGEITFERSYEAERSNLARKLIQTYDNGFAIIGYEAGYEFHDHVRVVKTDENGDKEWEYSTVGGQQYGFDIIQTDSGELIITSEVADSPSSTNSYLRVRKLDLFGNQMWSTSFFNNSNYDIRSGYIEHSDDGYVIVGKTIHDLYMIEIDEDGELLWSNEFDVAEREYVYSIDRTADNGYIVCGFTDIGWYISPKLLLMKIDNNGNKLWIKQFQDNNKSLGSSVSECLDKGFIIGGFTGLQRKMLSIKTDKNGNLPSNMIGNGY